jgi:hypothetical protein
LAPRPRILEVGCEKKEERQKKEVTAPGLPMALTQAKEGVYPGTTQESMGGVTSLMCKLFR